MRADGWSRSLGQYGPGWATDSPCDYLSITASHQASGEQACRGRVCVRVCVCVCVSGIDVSGSFLLRPSTASGSRMQIPRERPCGWSPDHQWPVWRPKVTLQGAVLGEDVWEWGCLPCECVCVCVCVCVYTCVCGCMCVCVSIHVLWLLTQGNR